MPDRKTKSRAKASKPEVRSCEIGGTRPCDMDFILEQDAENERREAEQREKLLRASSQAAGDC